MAKNKYLLWLVVLGLALGFGWYFGWSATTPGGQPPLTRLTTENQFVEQFNQAAADVRMVLLLSPT